MRRLFVLITLLLCVAGCGPDPHAEGRKYSAKRIKEVQSGARHKLSCPPLDLFESVARDPVFIENLHELTLAGDFDRYSNISLKSFVHLERVMLVDTKNTDSYLRALPRNIKTLVFDRTDLTSGYRSTDNEFVKSWLQAMTEFDSLETIFFNPWGRNITPIAAELLPELQNLSTLKLEWAREEDVSSLQKALPNCRVKLITEH